MSTQNELRYLTCLRGIAAVWVAVHHAVSGLSGMFIPQSDIMSRLIHRGWLAVDLFFILSGFILAYSYQHKTKSWGWVKDFWIKRFARVYPAHLVTLFIFLGIVLSASAIGAFQDEGNRYNLKEFLAQVFLFHGVGWFEPTGWNIVSWSISSEALAYLLFPILFYLMRGLIQPFVNFLVIVMIMSFTIWLALEYNDGKKYMLAFGYSWIRVLSEFIMGMALFKIYRKLKSSTLFVVPLVLAMAGIILQGLIANSFYDFMYLIYFMLIILSLALIPGSKKIPLFTWLGEISFAFYLIHSVVIMLMNQVIRRSSFLQEHSAISFGLFMLITTVGAWLIYEQVEVKGRKIVLNFFGQKRINDSLHVGKVS